MPPCGRCVAYSAIHPGDDHVQLVGFDVYAWRTKGRTSMADLFAPAMTDLRDVTALPVIVSETAAAGPSAGRDRWIREGYLGVLEAYPEVEGISYFDIDMGFAKHPERRMSDEDGSLAAYAELAADARFGGILDPDPGDPGDPGDQGGPAPLMAPFPSLAPAPSAAP